MKTGTELIAEERQRHVDVEGWTPEHDDQHQYGELVIQAAALAIDHTDAHLIHPGYEEGEFIDPWGLVRKHHGNYVRELVIAGALIAAEIDRIQRK